MKILLADDHGLFRDSMAVWIQQAMSQVEVIFAASWQDVERQLNPSIKLLMLDLAMPGMHGAASIELIRKLAPTLPILVVSANEEQQTIQHCRQLGANGYITKASSGKTILQAVEDVLAGKSFFVKNENPSQSPAIEEILNKKQIQLLGHLAQGKSNRQIAETMFLSEGTVKQYVSQLLRILQVDNRTQAGNKARQVLGIGGLLQ